MSMPPCFSRELQILHEPAQTSSNITETGGIINSHSYYDWHYNQPFHVDKSLLMKELLKTKHACISAPSKFGKTLNMDMVRRFVEIEVNKNGKAIKLDVNENKRCLKEVHTRSKNFELFEGKKIST
ncbi:hypothetical protein PV326_010929, partial [Microctonus aethiopoides]